jgi:hypothetical protein
MDPTRTSRMLYLNGRSREWIRADPAGSAVEARKGADVAGGIGDFSVSAGKPEGFQGGSASRPSGGAAPAPGSVPAVIPYGARTHYIILRAGEGAQGEPIRFHNGLLDAIKGTLDLKASVPLPDMPGFFPAGAVGEMSFQGRHVFHLDSALKDQPLFSHLESLKSLVQRVSDRRLAFPEFVGELNRIPLPSEWRNEIVNGLFDHASAAPAPEAPKSKVSQDLDKLMGMFKEGEAGGTAMNPGLGRFIHEVGRDSTGFTLRAGAAKELLEDVTRTLATLRSGLLKYDSLSSTLGFMASLQRLSRLAKGREKQTVHLWADVPEDPKGVLLADADGETPDLALALVVVDPFERKPDFLRRVAHLAATLSCPLLVQLPGEELPADHPALAALAAGLPSHTFFFAGGVASRVDGDSVVFRPAALAFLEGLVASKETVDHFIHRSLALEDQDVFTDKGQARATDKLLDQGAVDALAKKRINRVNGVRNRAEAVFPLLYPWKDQ